MKYLHFNQFEFFFKSILIQVISCGFFKKYTIVFAKRKATMSNGDKKYQCNFYTVYDKRIEKCIKNINIYVVTNRCVSVFTESKTNYCMCVCLSCPGHGYGTAFHFIISLLVTFTAFIIIVTCI